MRSSLKAIEREFQFKNVSVTAVEFDEEHQHLLRHLHRRAGRPRNIDWALANAAESRQLLAKYAQMREQLVRPRS